VTTITLVALVALAAPVIWGLSLIAWVTWTLEAPPPEVDDQDVRDIVAAIWISGFGGGLLVAEALQAVWGR
jgi:hypothetical protein